MSEPSEGMQELVSDFGADCINYGCNQLRPMVNYPLIENVDCKAKEAALLTAIAELEQRAAKAKAERDVFEKHAAIQVHEIREWIERVNKWKRVAVAIERCNQAADTYNRAQIRGELLGAREDAWTKADLEFAEATAELGNEWTEAIGK